MGAEVGGAGAQSGEFLLRLNPSWAAVDYLIELGLAALTEFIGINVVWGPGSPLASHWVSSVGKGALKIMLSYVLPKLFRAKSYMILEAACSSLSAPVAAGDEHFVVLQASNAQEQGEVCEALLALGGDVADYLEDLRLGRVVAFVILCSGAVVAHAQLRLLEEQDQLHLGIERLGAALIGNDFTVPSYQGAGCQSRSVAARCEIARDAGFLHVVAETSRECGLAEWFAERWNASCWAHGPVRDPEHVCDPLAAACGLSAIRRVCARTLNARNRHAARRIQRLIRCFSPMRSRTRTAASEVAPMVRCKLILARIAQGGANEKLCTAPDAC